MIPVQYFGNSRVDLFLQSSGRVGGDLVGSYAINESSIGLYSIDVSGHGVASALLSARLAGQLSSTVPEQNIALERSGDGYIGVAPATAVKSLNKLLLDEIETEHYFTICLAEIDLNTGRGVFCQAGHPPPAILRGNHAVEFMGSGGMPVGLIDDASFEDTEIPSWATGQDFVLLGRGNRMRKPKRRFF